MGGMGGVEGPLTLMRLLPELARLSASLREPLRAQLLAVFWPEEACLLSACAPARRISHSVLRDCI